MDQWIVAGSAIIGVLGTLYIQASKAGGRDRQINDHERRIICLEDIALDHTRDIGTLNGELKGRNDYA